MNMPCCEPAWRDCSSTCGLEEKGPLGPRSSGEPATVCFWQGGWAWSGRLTCCALCSTSLPSCFWPGLALTAPAWAPSLPESAELPSVQSPTFWSSASCVSWSSYTACSGPGGWTPQEQGPPHPRGPRVAADGLHTPPTSPTHVWDARGSRTPTASHVSPCWVLHRPSQRCCLLMPTCLSGFEVRSLCYKVQYPWRTLWRKRPVFSRVTSNNSPVEWLYEGGRLSWNLFY